MIDPVEPPTTREQAAARLAELRQDLADLHCSLGWGQDGPSDAEVSHRLVRSVRELAALLASIMKADESPP